ncbi:MAG: PTS glucose transporter subunit IIA [Erysipelotrichia bacterium]|nr:PTS glucose transporter subunit IIA [Erysipelotrichia bacterium]
MGLFSKLLKKEKLEELINIDDNDIVAIADGQLIDIKTISDPVFAQEMMGKSVAFRFNKDKITLCSPANGVLSVLFPTGHAFGVVAGDGVEIFVHCGINTVESNGDGFKKLKKKQGDKVIAGEPIVEVDINKLEKKYDMATMLIVTNMQERSFDFISPTIVKRGQSLIK